MVKGYLFLGGPSHGQIIEMEEGRGRYTVYKHDTPSPRVEAGYRTASEVLVAQIHYHKKLFQEDRRRYVVFILEGLEDNVALDLFKQYIDKIPVDEYLQPCYSPQREEESYYRYQLEQDQKVLDEKRRKQRMYDMLPLGPTGKPGKTIKTFVMAYCYGAGIKTLQKQTGLGMRRIKVMKRKIDGFGGLAHNEN